MSFEKSEIYGGIGSAVFALLLLLLLFLIKFSYIQKVQQAGGGIGIADLEESFKGNNRHGGGFFRPEPIKVLETPPASPAKPTPPTPANQQLISQRDESVALEQAKKEEQRRQEAEQQRIAEQRRREEQVRQEKTNQANSVVSGAFGSGGGQGSGVSTGDTRQGNPLGHGTDAGGNSWSLGGRGLNGTLSLPTYDRNEEGKITVNIRVDKSGSVTGATIGTPTEISDRTTRDAAIQAARRTRFTEGKDEAVGTITYYFKLN